MKRPDLGLVAIGIAALGVAAITVVRFGACEETAPVVTELPSPAVLWWNTAKKLCKSDTVDVFLEQAPPPAPEVAHRVTCLSLANRIPAARAALEPLAANERLTAVRRVFTLIHPIADRGDDIAAGPAMELVIEFWPQNYQAIYHAGIAAYQKREDERAKRHLETFLGMYKKEDGFRKRAKTALSAIEATERGDQVARPRIPLH